MDGRWVMAVDWSYVGHNLLMVYLKNDAVWGQYHGIPNPQPMQENKTTHNAKRQRENLK